MVMLYRAYEAHRPPAETLTEAMGLERMVEYVAARTNRREAEIRPGVRRLQRVGDARTFVESSQYGGVKIAVRVVDSPHQRAVERERTLGRQIPPEDPTSPFA